MIANPTQALTFKPHGFGEVYLAPPISYQDYTNLVPLLYQVYTPIYTNIVPLLYQVYNPINTNIVPLLYQVYTPYSYKPCTPIIPNFIPLFISALYPILYQVHTPILYQPSEPYYTKYIPLFLPTLYPYYTKYIPPIYTSLLSPILPNLLRLHCCCSYNLMETIVWPVLLAQVLPCPQLVFFLPPKTWFFGNLFEFFSSRNHLKKSQYLPPF